MLLDRELNPKHQVVNTGIVGAIKEYIQKLKKQKKLKTLELI